MHTQIRGIALNHKRLKLYSDERGNGIEYPTGVGDIDILACDESDSALIVFELKRATSPDRAVGQITRYLGWVRVHLANRRPVRGVIVARQTCEYLRYAMVAVPDVSVYEYSVKFALTPARARRRVMAAWIGLVPRQVGSARDRWQQRRSERFGWHDGNVEAFSISKV